MKKLLAMLMALCLLTAWASAESMAINWTDVEPLLAAHGISGAFDSVYNTGVKLFAPANYPKVELSEDALYNGYVYYLETGDLLGKVLVTVTDPEWRSLEEYADYIHEIYDVGVERVILNGMPAVVFAEPDNEDDVVNLALFTRAGLTIFAFYSGYDVQYRALAQIMMASIQAE